MNLSVDAEVDRLEDLAKRKNIDMNTLENIEDDLDLYEQVSLIFLLVKHYSSEFQRVLNLFKDASYKRHMISAFLKTNLDNIWQDRFLEAICIIKNREVVRKLGLSFEEMKVIYLPHIVGISLNLNVLAKTLYALCECLSEEESRLLLESVKKDGVQEECQLKDIPYLEFHILYWAQLGYISICSDGRGNMINLLKHLKQLNLMDTSIYAELEKYKSSTTDKGVCYDVEARGNSLVSLHGKDDRTTGKANLLHDTVDTGICIIINQMYFHGTQYETRFGTNADCDKLVATFRGFGFKTCVYENLTKEAVLSKLENIIDEFDVHYKCIVLCILSHGYKGGIISSDGGEISIQMIEDKICCRELRKVTKVVIIQACQGRMTGQIDVTDLDIDGPSRNNVADFSDFFIFMSTMQGFVSIRHKREGSWFIQTLCDVLIKGSKKGATLLESATEVMESLQQKRGLVNGTYSAAQLPELRSRLTPKSNFRFPPYTEQ